MSSVTFRCPLLTPNLFYIFLCALASLVSVKGDAAQQQRDVLRDSLVGLFCVMCTAFSTSFVHQVAVETDEGLRQMSATGDACTCAGGRIKGIEGKTKLYITLITISNSKK